MFVIQRLAPSSLQMASVNYKNHYEFTQACTAAAFVKFRQSPNYADIADRRDEIA